MIIIQARIPVQSDKRNLAYERIHEFVNAARVEPGCINCEALISLEDPDLVVLHQTWRGADDLRLHAAGTPLDAFLDALPQFVDGEVSTIRYEAVPEGEAEGEGEPLADDEPAIEGVPQGVTLH